MSRLALVTGGTRGIGAEVSKALKAAGRNVVASYAVNDQAAESFTAETAIMAERFDVADFAAAAAAVARITAAHG
ncbi:MAG: SDR family NAD(P)-dependent oxidoreductase, partial [Acetobacteraceae bacterium]